MAISDLEAEVVALRAENEALRAELIDARKTIKLLKMLDVGAPAGDLTQSDKVRKANLEAELKEERDSKEKERDKSRKTDASVAVLAVPGTPEEKKREKSPSRSTGRGREDETSSVFSFLSADPVERFGHVFRFKKDAPDAALKEVQVSAPADFRQGEAIALPIAKVSSGSTSEVSVGSPKRDTKRPEVLVFGIPLEGLMKGGTLPPFLVQALAALELVVSRAGLFAIPTSSAHVTALRERFVLSATPLDLSGVAPEHLAALIVAFFEELPDVLVGLNSLHKLIQTVPIADRRYKTLSQRFLLMSLHPNSRMLLECMIKFLRKIVAGNGATSQELAKLFAPLLFKLRFGSPRVGESRPTAEDITRLTVDLLGGNDDLFSIESEADCKWAPSETCLQLKFATPSRIVELFSYFCYCETHFIDVFALTRPYFMTASETLAAFTQLIGSFKADEPWQRQARVNVLANLRSWAEQQRHRLLAEREFVSSLHAFVAAHAPAATEEEKPHLDALSTCFEKHSLLRSQVTMTSFGKFAQVRRTMRDKIPMDEFLFKRFTKPDQCPSFTEFAAKFEQWGLWVASQVVSRKSTSERANVIEKMIAIAHLNNYNTAAAMLYGLFNRSVTRMKSTWVKVDKKRLAEMKKIETLFATSRNYKNYRETLLNTTPPLVPHIALVPKDLFAIEETNATIVDNLVNLDKMRLLHTLLSRVHRWQMISYKTLQPDEQLLAYFKQLRYMPDDTLYEVSKEAEPHRK